MNLQIPAIRHRISSFTLRSSAFLYQSVMAFMPAIMAGTGMPFSMVRALCIRIIAQASGKKGLYLLIRISCRAGIKSNPLFRESGPGSVSYTHLSRRRQGNRIMAQQSGNLAHQKQPPQPGGRSETGLQLNPFKATLHIKKEPGR